MLSMATNLNRYNNAYGLVVKYAQSVSDFYTPDASEQELTDLTSCQHGWVINVFYKYGTRNDTQCKLGS